ncbi:MAG: hypothetical protein ABI625_03235 [bacterium]
MDLSIKNVSAASAPWICAIMGEIRVHPPNPRESALGSFTAVPPLGNARR